ncbi:hypothetical protein M0L66_000332 [Pseudomonas aeruginosa]|uniref:hypothetical protein n=1 Tax=Pseudomonas aeruginosa TaxID=287 RepID=UPI000B492AD1|nr:hypothetical protein [Pseudomonas aeruginosa]EIU4985170.1 nucleotide exchange factor GrpE [Pseudomonas aeruginosa]EKA7888837.1 hypothetical protein [Pseudomonas aeruginosa]EKU0811686.1 hypothetical protein [Pseudomonas aeruginosa]EKV0211011.1 hypothetical protein [Pseudomonas aeruginosa]EKX5065631.1 hypothetical protein [Pseudomonas aeruginosa]
MSEVKKISPVGNIYGWEESQFGEFVLSQDYEALADEAQALREEVAKLTQYNKSLDEENTRLLADCEKTDREVAALRARVAVVPNRLPRSSDIASIHQHSIGWNACLDELARINGMTVSEGLVQGMAKFAREIICGALDGGSFDGADIQESAERHGLIAKQVMNEPCRGPEEYCACAWSTSFPAECYRVTPELRALLNEDKENGDHAA